MFSKKIKLTLQKFHWILYTQFGFDPRILIRSIFSVPSYLKNYLLFKKNFSGKINFLPCLQDHYEESGATKNEYFWQDLFVAQTIFKNNPIKHVDIGSRVDGFVAHIASFRDCEVFDVRPNSTAIPGIRFHKANVMDKSSLPYSIEGYCDSVSCLHALEHFGLGRYGDPINPKGYLHGLENISQLLKPNGTFYLSTPIGQERVEFNANWVFDPKKLIQFAFSLHLHLEHFYLIKSHGIEVIKITDEILTELRNRPYELGLFLFKKKI